MFEVLLRNLARSYVEREIARLGIEHLVEVEVQPAGILVRIPAALRAAASVQPKAGESTAAEARKIVATAITDGDLASAERSAGKAVRFGTHHTLTIEVPDHYDESALTAEDVLHDPAISIVARIPPPAAEPEAPPPPPVVPLAVSAPVELEPVAPKAPTKIVHTSIADEQGRLLTVEIPEDYDEAELTREAIAADPAISVVSRVRPEVPVVSEPVSATATAIAMPAPVELEAAPPPATLVHTSIADASGKLYVVEVAADVDVEALTAENIESTPGVTIVARVAPPPAAEAPAEPEPAAEMPPVDSAPPVEDSAPPAEQPPAADKPADAPSEITMPEDVTPDNGAAITPEPEAPAAEPEPEPLAAPPTGEGPAS